MENTPRQFDQVISECRAVYVNKMKDYGLAWRILRTPSLTDQIFIKASRIRSIQQKGEHKVEEGIKPEFIGIVNYSVMALIQLELGVAEEPDLDSENALRLYDTHIHRVKDLMLNKNHDYDEAWRGMRISSMADIILMKLHRIKQMEDRDGAASFSEGLEANYADIINYAIFSLIMIEESQQTK